MHEPCYTVQEKAQKGKQSSEKAVRLIQSVQTEFGWESWKVTSHLITEKKKKKSFNWALCSKEMFHPFHPIVHWLHECKSFGYNSQSICEDQTILMLLNHIIWKYLFWNLKIPNTPSLHFFLTESVALGLCRYFFMTSVWLQCQEILRSS